jgi:hypothetical protein
MRKDQLKCLDTNMDKCGGYQSFIRPYFLGLEPAVCSDGSSAAAPAGLVSLAVLLLGILVSRLL